MELEHAKITKQINADLTVLFRNPPLLGTGANARSIPALVANALRNGQSTGAPYTGWKNTAAYQRLRSIAEQSVKAEDVEWAKEHRKS